MPEETFDARADECSVCGRLIDPANSIYELLPREIPCGGCQAEKDAFLLEEEDVYEQRKKRVGLRMRTIQVKVGTKPRYTPEQAHGMAKRLHGDREAALLDAIQRRNLERNAEGLSARDGTTRIKDFTDRQGRTVTVTQVKERAARKLEALGPKGDA